MTSIDFNLMDHPWLPHTRIDGSPHESSLRDLLLNAHRVRDLNTDVPTQYPALLRLLLAFLHRALGDKREGSSFPRGDAEWQELYAAGRFPADRVNAYADTWRDHFGLFDTEAPFFQAAELTAQGGKTSALLVSSASSGNNAPIFSFELDDRPAPLTPAQAARWLLHAHAWDTAGIKTGAEGDRSAKAGKTMGNRIGPLGELGVLIPAGSDLFQTLMLNLIVLEDDLTSARDLPVWERSPMDASWRERAPLGLLDLYTWPGRRIRLIHESGQGSVTVPRALICAGDRLSVAGARVHPREPHTSWLVRRSGKKSTADSNGPSERFPLQHRPERELWRGLGGILGRASAAERNPGLRPQVLSHIGARLHRMASPPVLRMRAYGIIYGLQNAVISETYFDALPLPVALLAKDSYSELGRMAVDCVSATDRAAWALGQFAADLVFAEGGGPDAEDAARSSTTRAYFAALDHEFRTWIAGLAEEDLVEDYATEWHRTAHAAAAKAADTLAHKVGPSALGGRGRKDARDKEKKPVKVNLVIAKRSLRGRLDRYLDMRGQG